MFYTKIMGSKVHLYPYIMVCPVFATCYALWWGCSKDGSVYRSQIGNQIMGFRIAFFTSCDLQGSRSNFKSVKSNISNAIYTSDAPVLERFGTSLPGDRLYLNLVDARPKTVAICNIRTAIHSKNQDNDIWTKVVQGLWSRMICLPDEGFFSEQNSFRKLLKTFLFDRWPLLLRICGIY